MLRALWLGAALALACEVPPTQLVVAVRTDMAIPGELDAFSVVVEAPADRTVTVDGPGKGAYGVPILLTRQSDLPATFGLRPHGKDPKRKVTVRAVAMRDGAALFETRAVTSFVEGEQLRLDLFLAGRCIDQQCAPEETCSLGGCVPAAVPPEDLPDWNGDVPDLDVDASVPDSGGVASVGYPKLVAWTDDALTLLVLSDAVATPDGSVWFIGHVRGSASIEGDPAGSTQVHAETARMWAACFTSEGAPCGLTLFGDGGGNTLSGPATLGSEGQLLLTGGLLGAPELGTGPLDVGAGLGSTFVMTWKADEDLRQVGIVRAPDVVRPLAVTAVPRLGTFLLGAWVETAPMTVVHFNGSTEDLDPLEGGQVLAFDPDMIFEANALEQSVDEVSTMAAASSASVARFFATSAGGASHLIGNFYEPAAVRWSRFGSLTECSSLAAAASGDGITMVGCSVSQAVVLSGDVLDAPGDLWLGVFEDENIVALATETLLGGAAVEQVSDAAGADGSTIVWGGDYTGDADLGGVPLADQGHRAAFAFSTTVVGRVVEVDWARVFPSTGDAYVRTVAIDSEHAVVVAGYVSGQLATDPLLGDDGARTQIWAQRFAP